jgi:hypothetical protein
MSMDGFKRLPPPQKDDVLFTADSDFWTANACLHGSYSHVAYREGYRKAAWILAKHVCETATDQDYLVYPIVHNYRHHVEVALKQLIVIGSFLIDEELDYPHDTWPLNQHGLNHLWAHLKRLLREVCKNAGESSPDHEEIDGIDSYIRQLTEADPESYSARYARSKKGERSMADLEHINIAIFADAMERLADSLGAIDSMFCALKDAKDERLAAWSRAAD